ncbi:MAG: biotin carboxylase N-terminal domain-containing protein, partial [Streptosporangiaceae bacterium]
MFESVLVANRGEIASRVIRTVRAMGLKAIAVYSDADADLPFVAEADDAVALGGAAPARSYLHQDAILEAALRSNAQAIHPGYGFLAENAGFARRVIEAGLVWIGPDPATIDAMGDKIRARNLMEAAGVPVAAGTRAPVATVGDAVVAAAGLGYPLMVKAAAGGGGIGIGVAFDETALVRGFDNARADAERLFGSPDLLLERYLEGARHVEIQILGLADGTVLALGERDCSVQRRYQKVVEETPSPGVSPDLRARMLAAAVRAGEAVAYRGAGTVECLVDPVRQDFVFLEMNTSLQAEHTVTELVTRIDLVEQQLLIAAGEPVSFRAVEIGGHAIEFRVYAEDAESFLPGPGQIKIWIEPEGEDIRVDAGYAEGNTVTSFYDPLMAKLCVFGVDRPAALTRAGEAAAAFHIEGPRSNLPFLTELLGDREFAA